MEKGEKYRSLDSIRKIWIKIFTDNSYLFIDPFSLIPEGDRSLLWINSGVAALKKYFNSPELSPAKNLVNCQPVIRTNDIERIDANSYHQTLFEMLGCFSIAGNFKREVIPLIWNFFTGSNYLSINPQRLFVTVLDSDHETYDLWAKQPSIIPANIILATRETNFWDMGDGPCGPNTEIYYQIHNIDSSKSVTIKEIESKDFIEIANIVFSEFYHRKDKYLPLPSRCVDVGAGLERIALVLQNVSNTFQTDIWEKPVSLLREYCSETNADQTWRTYVIADHLRTSIFAISDGALSGHKLHGYVLKKLLKRSCLFAYILKIGMAEMLTTCEMIIESNSSFYPKLLLQKKSTIGLLEEKLQNFFSSFEISCKSIKRYLKEVSDKEISPEKIFFWYDTEGVPLELICLSLDNEKRIFNQASFQRLLNEQKNRSSSRRVKTDAFGIN